MVGVLSMWSQSFHLGPMSDALSSEYVDRMTYLQFVAQLKGEARLCKLPGGACMTEIS